MGECEVCGSRFVRVSVGRVRRFCSAGCRQKAYRARTRARMVAAGVVDANPAVSSSRLLPDRQKRRQDRLGGEKCPPPVLEPVRGEKTAQTGLERDSFGVAFLQHQINAQQRHIEHLEHQLWAHGIEPNHR